MSRQILELYMYAISYFSVPLAAGNLMCLLNIYLYLQTDFVVLNKMLLSEQIMWMSDQN